jgi:type I restriction enzyme S subunit
LPNRALFAEVKDREHPNEEMLSVTITKGIIRQKALLDGTSKKDSSNLDKSSYKLVQPRDIAYNKMRAWQGAIGSSALRGIISPAYVVMRLRKDDDLPSYFHHLYRTPLFAKEAERWSYGITSDMWSLRPEHFKMIYTPEPPPDEQAAIVRFLNWANGRLERAIRAKRKVIALLNEQKQAIIHRAVTRGLDPTVPLKPSDIPWLAECPGHWKWIPIKRLLSSMDYGTSEQSIENGSIRILTMGNIQNGEVTIPKSGGLDDVASSLLIGHHDLLFTRTNGNPNLVGKVGIFRGEFSDRVSFASYLVRLRVNGLHDPQWLHMVLNSVGFWPFARSHALVNLQTNLNSTRYGKFAVPVPPLDEQQSIVKWVSGESRALNVAISGLEREIELLREYRIRLVADVVTGKLDVREAATRLPEDDQVDIPEEDADLIIDPEAVDEELAV